MVITIVFRSLILTSPILTVLEAKPGSRPGELNFPRGVTIDSDGMVYIADCDNNRVQKFTPEGEVLAVIDRKGEGGSQLNKPYGVYVDSNNILYVTEYGSNTVCMFSTSGRFLGYVGNCDGSSFKHPWFITSDQYKLYISDENGVSTSPTDNYC